MRSHTPALAHRRKRLNTLFQLSKQGVRSLARVEDRAEAVWRVSSLASEIRFPAPGDSSRRREERAVQGDRGQERRTAYYHASVSGFFPTLAKVRQPSTLLLHLLAFGIVARSINELASVFQRSLDFVQQLVGAHVGQALLF